MSVLTNIVFEITVMIKAQEDTKCIGTDHSICFRLHFRYEKADIFFTFSVTYLPVVPPQIFR